MINMAVPHLGRAGRPPAWGNVVSTPYRARVPPLQAGARPVSQPCLSGDPWPVMERSYHHIEKICCVTVVAANLTRNSPVRACWRALSAGRVGAWALFDHLVGVGEQGRWNGEAERLGG